MYITLSYTLEILIYTITLSYTSEIHAQYNIAMRVRHASAAQDELGKEKKRE